MTIGLGFRYTFNASPFRVAVRLDDPTLPMIFRARLDVSWSDTLYAVGACAARLDRERWETEVRERLPRGPEAIVCLAARSGLDLLLGALALEPGSEVLVSAVTIPDIPKIIRAHGLVPVPVDVDAHTLQPNPGALEAAVSGRSRVLLVAHLFGAMVDLRHARAFAREHGLFFVEDLAQSYVPRRSQVSDESDAVMLSFGPIKTATAYGGGAMIVTDPVVRARMREAQRVQPIQENRRYLARVVKFGASQLLCFPALFALFRLACGVLGRDYDTVLKVAARGFHGGDLLARLRRRPAAPLLALLARRLGQGSERIDDRAAAGAEIAHAVEGVLAMPGRGSAEHSYWVFPVLAENPEALRRYLREQGFDAVYRSGSLIAVDHAPERPDVTAPVARQLVDSLLFLPAYPEMGRAASARLIQALRGVSVPLVTLDAVPREVASPGLS